VIVQGTSVGLDVHELSVVAHAVDEETGKVARARLVPGSRRGSGLVASAAGPGAGDV
jgi:transposase